MVELLSQLVDQSLVQVEQQAQASFADARYQLLETIRQYSQAKLRSSSEATTLYARHRDWCLVLAMQADEQPYIDAATWDLAWARGRQLPLEQLIAPWERDDDEDKPWFASCEDDLGSCHE